MVYPLPEMSCLRRVSVLAGIILAWGGIQAASAALEADAYREPFKTAV
jgi:hypothetical protein